MVSAKRPQTTREIKSASRSPFCDLNRLLTAKVTRVTDLSFGVVTSSGCTVRRPIIITLLYISFLLSYYSKNKRKKSWKLQLLSLLLSFPVFFWIKGFANHCCIIQFNDRTFLWRIWKSQFTRCAHHPKPLFTAKGTWENQTTVWHHCTWKNNNSF